jgi:hypothetical protein
MTEATQAAECPNCLATLPEPGAECGLCASMDAAHEPAVEIAFVSGDAGKRWGFLERQDDGTELFVEVPKQPLHLGGFVPPVTFELYTGPRTIIVEPGE